MQDQHYSYMYDKGQFLAIVRDMGGRSIGVTVPAELRRTLGLRKGMRVVVKIRVAKEKDGPEEDFRWRRIPACAWSARRCRCQGPSCCPSARLPRYRS